jgi:hypothetical protein
MGDGGVTISLGETLPYLEQRFREMIGKDQATKEITSWFNGLQETALVQASQVQCIGMHRPLPMREIYQPTRLIVKDHRDNREKTSSFGPQDKTSRSITQSHAIEDRIVGVNEFLKLNENAVVYAGPGWGKTTFLHHVFIECISRKHVLPVLISLRRPTAVVDLSKFVTLAKAIQKKEGKPQILLLIDGYDELQTSDRKLVSEAILQYNALHVGSFYVTCREYYRVFDVAAPEARIDGFTIDDQYRFARTFLEAFGSTLNPITVVDEFHSRGFADFLSHPLLLALACIVKTSTRTVQSRSVIRLLARAIDVLTYRWDEAKGIDRPSRTPLDGRDRIQILKRIAYKMKSRVVAEPRALAAANEQLDKLGFETIDAHSVLIETAQFFGIFVPQEDGWTFVHRTLHDFLAAQFWVETGGFANSHSYEWDARTAYAACLTPDATSVMEKSLLARDGVESFVEILSNAPDFDHKRIADAIVAYYGQHELVHYFEQSDLKISTHLRQDFIRLASSKFLNDLVERCCVSRDKTTDTIAAYCMWELFRRDKKLNLQTYHKAMRLYKSAEFTFHVRDYGHLRLDSMKPA